MIMNPHLGLLCDIGELGATLAGSANIESFFAKIVRVVAKHLRADVCSIYLYDDVHDVLILKETVGLEAYAKETVRLKLDEGLVGMALQESRPICENEASKHPRFKFFQGINEEMYESFLAVPIMRSAERIGVLVVQRKTANYFGDHDVMALRATASQLAGAIENARILISLRSTPDAADAPKVLCDLAGLRHLKGRVASEGLVCAESVVLVDEMSNWLYSEHPFTGRFGREDFEASLAQTELQLEDLQRRLEERLPEVASLIFSAHILMLKDPNFTGQMLERIESGANPPDAVLAVARRYIDIFKSSTNAYMREKVQDVEDLAKRLIGNILHKIYEPTSDCHRRIVIARELYPSDVLKLASESVAGIVLVGGGVTSHVSILASSLDIPMVIVENLGLMNLPDHTQVLLDAESGDVYCQPDASLVEHFADRHDERQVHGDGFAACKPDTHMADGTRIELLANINLLGEIRLANQAKAVGIGLYRTEFPFMIRSDFPSEEEQLVVYESLASGMPGKEITFRTLDVGGDKLLPYLPSMNKEENPILGMRSIRFSLQHPDIFRRQLRAILRAGADVEQLRIMFPMISSLDEFLAAREEVLLCQRELEKAGIVHHPSPKIGLMVEIPSVVHVADELAAVADFFCIGTNDFIQFMLAVDRGNERLASYFQPGHPAVLRGLKQIADAAIRHNVDLSICGEMAHEREYIPFLIGIGIRRLSINPRFLPRVQAQIAGLTLEEAQAEARALLARPSCGSRHYGPKKVNA